jgi:hypothetical protein
MYLGSVKDWFNQQHGQITRGDFSFFFLICIFLSARPALVLGTQPTANQARNRCGGGKSLLGQCTCSDKREMRDRPFDCRILCSVYGSVMREILCKETPL